MSEQIEHIAERALDLHRKGKQREALALLRNSHSRFKAPHLYVLEGRLTQLSDLEDNEELERAEDAFRKAVAIDQDYVEAYLELGWFYLNVRDDATKAEEFFDKAAELTRDQLIEALEGRLRCIREKESPQMATNHFDQLQGTLLSPADLEKLRNAIADTI